MCCSLTDTFDGKTLILSGSNTLFWPDTIIALLLSAALLITVSTVLVEFSFNVLNSLNAALVRSNIWCLEIVWHENWAGMNIIIKHWDLWSWWEDRGGQDGCMVLRDWAAYGPVCVILARQILKTQHWGLPPALSLHSLTFPTLLLPLFPFPSSSPLMICSACRCLADWCPLTAPLMRKGCTPPPLHTDTHTHSVLNSYTSQRYIFTMHVWHTCTVNVNLRKQLRWDRLSHINKSHLFVQLHVNRHICRHTCSSRWQTLT